MRMPPSSPEAEAAQVACSRERGFLARVAISPPGEVAPPRSVENERVAARDASRIRYAQRAFLSIVHGPRTKRDVPESQTWLRD